MSRYGVSPTSSPLSRELSPLSRTIVDHDDKHAHKNHSHSHSKSKSELGSKSKRSKSVSHLADRNKILGSKMTPIVAEEAPVVEEEVVAEAEEEALPQRVETAEKVFRRLSVGSNDMRRATSHAQLSSTAHGMRLLSKDIQKSMVVLQVQRLMVVTKKQDSSLIYLTREMVEWILVNYPNIEVYVDESVESSKRFDTKGIIRDSRCASHKIRTWNPEMVAKKDDFFDLVITLGGDGTVLYVSSLFQRSIPPVMSFSLGSLGFLTNFNYENFRQSLPRVINSKIRSKMRMRLCCRVFRKRRPNKDGSRPRKKFTMAAEYHVLNELTIDRGPSAFISMLEVFGDNSLLTVAQADGLIIATPTGSTAYSLSAGGSLVYPSVNAIAVTPICPHTLSFRPIILPDSMKLKVKVPLNSRATAWAAFDGKNRVELFKGDYICITASPHSFPTLESSPTEFIDSISRTLNWNAREPQKSFAHMLSQKNQKNYVSDTEKQKQDVPEVRAPSDDEEEEDDATDSESASQFKPKPADSAVTPKLKANFQL